MDAPHKAEAVAGWRQSARALVRYGWRASFCLTFLLFIAVRLYHLDKAPAHNDTTDEYAWTWSGMTLLQTGKPRAWSNLKAYVATRKELDWRDHHYKIVEPWLDHPPLYSLYAGGWMLAWGTRDMFEVDLWRMRLGTLPLAALSFIFLGLFLRQFLTRGALLIALVFYAVLPLCVLHQRLVVSENFFVPLTLAVLLLLQAQAARFSSYRVFALLLLSLLLALTKVAALSCSAFLVLWALASDSRDTRWLNAGSLVVGTCAGIAGYILYARGLDADIFDRVLKQHEDRFRGFGGLEMLLFEPQLINKAYKDILPVAGAVFALAGLVRLTAAPWSLGALIYAACMAFFVDDRKVFGWYFIPLYPWLCAGFGWAIGLASRKRMLGLSLLWCSVALLRLAQFAHSKGLMPAEPLRMTYLFGLLALAGAWCAWPRLARATIPSVNGALVCAVALSCLYEIYLR